MVPPRENYVALPLELTVLSSKTVPLIAVLLMLDLHVDLTFMKQQAID